MSRLCVVFLLLLSSAAAQFDAGLNVRHVRVRVAFTNGGCDLSTRVTLMGHGGPMADGVANDQCIVDFTNIPEGTYHLTVTGQGIPTTDSGSIELNSTMSAEFEVRVKRDGESGGGGGVPASSFVSAADLGVPDKARKEFSKANELIAKQDFSHAIERLDKAIAIYPGYVGAYNNLAVIYSRLGDRNKERDALLKAIGIDDHCAPAYLNLGRLSITTGDFPGAEAALTKAASSDPTDAMTLVLLTYAEFMDHRFDDVIATSKRAHLLQGEHAFGGAGF
jgi:tetratricopeptide (TPR) repeat protein